MKYLSAKKLGIREIDRKYVILTMKDLEKMTSKKSQKKINGVVCSFNMKNFLAIRDQDDEVCHQVPNGCKTSACIAGWMILKAHEKGELRKLITSKVCNIRKSSKALTLHNLDTIASRFGAWHDNGCKGENDWNGMPTSLGRLFYSNRGDTPKMAAKRLRHYLTTGEIKID